MGLWRDWAKRMHSVWKVIDEIEREGGPDPNAGIQKVEAGGGKRTVVWGAIAAAVVIVAVGGYFLRDTLFPPPESAVGNQAAQTIVPVAQAQIAVASDPPGADVRINGAFMGQTPLEQEQVPAGDVVVTLRRSGYELMTDTLALAEDDSTAVNYTLVELTGRLRIESTPSGAAITVDGMETGQVTPATIENLSVISTHQIVLQLAGYNPRVYSAERVEADSTRTLSHPFSRRTASLTVVSQPAGAEIWIDGTQVGATPLPIERVSYGQHKVTVRLEGYAEWSQTLQIPVPDNRLEVALDALAPGTIVFSVTPWADVYIDGKLVVEKVLFRELPYRPGSYVIELRNPGFETHSQEYRVVSGETLRIEYTFTN
jgi:hypothetical protein